MALGTIGLAVAQLVFQVHGVDEHGRAVLGHKLHRHELTTFLEQLSRCAVFLEACGAGHDWGRRLTGLGHEVKPIAPEAGRPFVKRRKKNGAVDAAALRVAGSRPELQFVPIKSVRQQAVLTLHAARSPLVKRQTMLADAIRGPANEFGLVVPQGRRRLEEPVAQVTAAAGIPAEGRQAPTMLHEQLQATEERIAMLEAQIVADARQDTRARRLATIPGIGPITASLIAATLGDNSAAFRSARHFAAWLGLVPRQHATGGKPRLGRITKAGHAEIRRLRVMGAAAMLRRAETWNSAAGIWLRGVLARRPVRLTTAALANEMARIAWALPTRNDVYRAQGRSKVAAPAAA